MLELPNYTIEKQIGKGGMARVYLALHEGLERRVAIKVMSKHLDEDNSNFGERFMSEAKIVAQLSHQNIITIFDVGTHEGYHYITMELLPGTTLDDRIKQGLTPQESLRILKQVAAALDYAHQKNIIHRDVKPENIMFREDGSAVLTDFGIAKSITTKNKLTATGVVIGTPHYMSPEQAQGKEIGSFSDIYSLGVVFYEMLTGKVPYDAESSIAVVFKHITEPVPELSKDLSKYQMLMNGLMAKNIEQRYHSGQDIIADIEQLERDEIPDNATKIFKETEINNAATQLNNITPTHKKENKTAIYTGIAAILLLSIITGGYFYVEEQDKTQANINNEESIKKQKAEQIETNKLPAEVRVSEEQASQKKITDLANNKKIEDFLKQAETELLNTNLNNAYNKYKDVLRVDANNKFAKNGIVRVADQYLALANIEAIKINFDQANKYIATVIQIAPTHKNLAMTQQKVFDLRNQQLAKQAQNKQNEEVPVKDKKRRSFGGF